MEGVRELMTDDRRFQAVQQSRGLLLGAHKDGGVRGGGGGGRGRRGGGAPHGGQQGEQHRAAQAEGQLRPCQPQLEFGHLHHQRELPRHRAQVKNDEFLEIYIVDWLYVKMYKRIRNFSFTFYSTTNEYIYRIAFYENRSQAGNKRIIL